MRSFLYFYATVIGLFWGWYALSSADVGYVFFTRELHDLVFQIYGNVLGLDPATIPGLIGKATVIDTAIVLCVAAFFYRRRISAWWREKRRIADEGENVQAPVEASLSSTP